MNGLALTLDMFDRLPGVAHPGMAALTEREHEVARLICLGDTDFLISRRLGISIHTVDSHRTSLYRKLGVCCRAAAVTVYLAHSSRTLLKRLAAEAQGEMECLP